MKINSLRVLAALLFLALAFCLPAPQALAADNLVKLETNQGNIYIELDFEKAPISSANFKQYVEEGFYDGTVFHRVISDFMIQGGGFTPQMEKKHATHRPIQNEADNGLKNVKFSVAMARTDKPHSATSEFFINVKNNKFLNHTRKDERSWGYAVFGRVVSGQDVVEKIRVTPVKAGLMRNEVSQPTFPIVIRSAKMVTSVMD